MTRAVRRMETVREDDGDSLYSVIRLLGNLVNWWDPETRQKYDDVQEIGFTVKLYW